MKNHEEKFLITKEYAKSLLQKRKPDTNKGDYGRSIIIAGSENMPGAALLATGAALRSGSGITLALTASTVKPAFSALPEAMPIALTTDEWLSFDEMMLNKQLEAATAVALGPGMGKEKGVIAVTEAVLRSGKPAVVDADALNAIAGQKSLLTLLHPKVILTPHVKEMSRLISEPIDLILENPSDIAVEYAGRWNCVILLKGSATHIAAPDGRVAVNTSGNPGLAKGGSGDVLTGIITALTAQKLVPFEAACLGAYLLGAAADEALDILGNRMLLHRDIIDTIKETCNIILEQEDK